MQLPENTKPSDHLPKKHKKDNLSRGQYWRDHLKYEMVTHYKHKNQYPQYDYMTDSVRRMLNHMFRELERMGVRKDEVLKLLKHSGVPTKDLNKKLAGRMTIHFWEYLEWMKKLGFEMEVPKLHRPLYTHTIEGKKDEYRCRIIMQRNYEPKFFISMAMYEPKDFQIDFTACEMREPRPKERLVIDEVTKCVEDYFGGAEKLPIKRKTLRQIIRKKYYSGEIAGALAEIEE